MPVYRYTDVNETSEAEWFGPYDERPDVLDIDGVPHYLRPAVPAAVHSSAGTWNGSKPDYKSLHRPKEGKAIVEPGMEADVKYNAKHRYDKSDKAYEKAAADAVRDVLI